MMDSSVVIASLISRHVFYSRQEKVAPVDADISNFGCSGTFMSNLVISSLKNARVYRLISVNFEPKFELGIAPVVEYDARFVRLSPEPKSVLLIILFPTCTLPSKCMCPNVLLPSGTEQGPSAWQRMLLISDQQAVCCRVLSRCCRNTSLLWQICVFSTGSSTERTPPKASIF